MSLSLLSCLFEVEGMVEKWCGWEGERGEGGGVRSLCGGICKWGGTRIFASDDALMQGDS